MENIKLYMAYVIGWTLLQIKQPFLDIGITYLRLKHTYKRAIHIDNTNIDTECMNRINNIFEVF